MEKTANSLGKLMNQHIFDASKPELFIYKEYHVEAFHDSELKPTYRNIIRKVRNNLTQALNKFPTVLPHYLIIVINNSYSHDAAFVEFELKTILKRVLNDVARLLACRKEQLPRKVQNVALATEVFVMRPLPKPAAALKGDKIFKNTRRSMNNILDNLSQTFNFKPLNIDQINCAQRALFEKSGDLSEYRQECMWHSISEFIRIRDRQCTIALEKFTVSKEDSGTQVDESCFSKPRNGQNANHSDYHARETFPAPDAYYTRHDDRRRETRPDDRGQLDYYHRSYDYHGPVKDDGYYPSFN